MLSTKHYIAVVLIVLLPLIGCYTVLDTTRPLHTVAPAVIMDVRDDSLAPTAADWQTEVARRFPNSVVILCHGGSFVKGEWITQDFPGRGVVCQTVDQALTDERAEYPDRTIVILACNTDHLAIHGHPNCYYFPSEVWCVPDRDYNPGGGSPFNRITLSGNVYLDSSDPLRAQADPDVCGSIYEAISAD